ncbi:MAG: GNAT family N-acetyltransferase [Burkholderiaceae bacterium]
MTILTDRLLLRTFCESDVPAYSRIRAKPEVVQWLPGGADAAANAQKVAERAVSIFDDGWRNGGHAPWAVVERENGQLIGHLGLRVLPELNHETELLDMIDSDHWGRGYATEGAIAALGFGFAELALPFVIAPGITNQPRIDMK